MNRSKGIIKTSIVGIVINFILVAFKIVVGVISSSIAIILDAINNLTDGISQIVTIIGTKLSNMKPTKRHPFGLGRVEYLSSSITAAILISVGIISIKESFDKIIHPSDSKFTIPAILIIGFTILVKIIYGLYTNKKAKEYYSDNLKAVSKDALLDSLLTLSTLISAIIVYFNGYNIEGYLGCVISFLIIKSGFELLFEAVSSIIGERVDNELTRNIKNDVLGFDQVLGVYDLILHNYGVSKYIGSLHIEVIDSLEAYEIHHITRKISEFLYEKYNIIITVGIYASNVKDQKSNSIKYDILAMSKNFKEILQIHAFYYNKETQTVSCDIVFDFSSDPLNIINKLTEKLNEIYPNIVFKFAIDTNFSD